MRTGMNSSRDSILETPGIYEFIDFSGLIKAYRHATGCPLLKSDGDIIQPSGSEDIFSIKRPTPDEARNLLALQS